MTAMARKASRDRVAAAPNSGIPVKRRRVGRKASPRTGKNASEASSPAPTVELQDSPDNSSTGTTEVQAKDTTGVPGDGSVSPDKVNTDAKGENTSEAAAPEANTPASTEDSKKNADAVKPESPEPARPSTDSATYLPLLSHYRFPRAERYGCRLKGVKYRDEIVKPVIVCREVRQNLVSETCLRQLGISDEPANFLERSKMNTHERSMALIKKIEPVEVKIFNEQTQKMDKEVILELKIGAASVQLHFFVVPKLGDAKIVIGDSPISLQKEFKVIGVEVIESKWDHDVFKLHFQNRTGLKSVPCYPLLDRLKIRHILGMFPDKSTSPSATRT